MAVVVVVFVAVVVVVVVGFSEIGSTPLGLGESDTNEN